MQTKEELILFLEKDFQELLNKVSEESKPAWGSMDAQRMIEHLALAVKISNGKISLSPDLIHEKALKFKTIGLLSDRSLQRDFQNPALPAGLQPYEHESLMIAKQKLNDELKEFHAYFNLHGHDTTCIHNIFGELNYHEWLWFHYKHIMHHFMQFGIVPISDQIN